MPLPDVPGDRLAGRGQGEPALGLPPIVLVVARHDPKDAVRLGEVRVGLQRAAGQFACARHRFARRHTGDRGRQVMVGQSRIGQSEFGIERDRLLQALAAQAERLLREAPLIVQVRR